MKKGDWLLEPTDVDGKEINILMEVLSINKEEIQVKWYDSKGSWPEVTDEVIARDEIERYIATREIIIISEEEAAKYLLAGVK